MNEPLESLSFKAFRRSIALLVGGFGLVACGNPPARFPLREPVWKDSDLHSVTFACRAAPTPKEPGHISCAPEEYVSPLAWDAADNSLFRPVAQFFKVDPGGEAPNVNSLGEVPDSAWFTNRLGHRPFSVEELTRGACEPALLLDGETAADGSWVIDHGKDNGSSAGFRVKIPGKGKYMFKADVNTQPERPSAASVIGAAVYHAAGFYTSCEQVVYFRPSVLKLTPGLTVTNNTGMTHRFDEKALEAVLASATKRGDLIRMQASAWLPGKTLGPFQYAGKRDDDPNDRIPHEDRRDLRGGRLVAAWLDHFDAREQNSMNSWIADNAKEPESSPGYVRHYYLDTSDCLGSEWAWDGISRRLGHSYLLDFGDVGLDFLTFGARERRWDRARRVPGQEMFGYFTSFEFEADAWKNEYPNPTFGRMTEQDGAWMARILARFTPEMVRALAQMGRFSDPKNTAYLAEVLQERLERILARYLTKLSPIANLHLEGSRLCGVDLAAWHKVEPSESFHYAATFRPWKEATARPLQADAGAGSSVCVSLPHIAEDGGKQPDSDDRYVVVRIADGVAQGPIDVHLYDEGPVKGFVIAGIERPNP